MIDGNAKERQQQMQAREEIADQIQDFADELDTPGYQPTPYSVERIRDRLESILNTADEELERR
ncbi:hypothetical protein ACOZ4I_20330 (plasmid) [Haloarcula salina]|uniref:hypothetical protein n=1 Tax=Haloarcula salina TaxID=1429914 RepID=UPI003C7040D8